MKYYILYNDENHGPLSIEEMEEYDLNPSSRVWAPGWASWKDASEVEEIMAYFTAREQQSAALEEARRQEERRAPAASGHAVPGHQPQPAAPVWQPRESRPPETAPAAEQTPPAYNQYNQGNYSQPHPDPYAQPAPPAQPAQPTEWYMGINGRESGPFAIHQLVDAGLTRDTLVWCETMSGWTPAHKVPALAYLLPAPQQPQYRPDNQDNGYEPDPMNLQYEMANPWILSIIGSVLTAVVLILSIVIVSEYKSMLAGVAPHIITPLIWMICGLVSASRVNEAVRAAQYILAGRRCGAARAWGWITIVTAVASSIILIHFIATNL